MIKVFFSILLIFINFEAKTLSLNKILQLNDAASLKLSIKKYKKQKFLKILCEKQKKNKKPPTACYQLALNEDPLCLSLKLKDLNLKILNQTLQSNTLSPPCREHLKKSRAILIYRKKDFLLPELKNYWTDQKPFP